MNRTNTAAIRQRQIKTSQELMAVHLREVLALPKLFHPKDYAKIKSIIEKIQALKYDIEEKASAYDFPRLCRESMPVCRGECCKWQFPKNLDRVDFLISVWELTESERLKLVHMFESRPDTFFFCPMLKGDGCFFDFAQRPLECTVAFPCFSKDAYWEYATEKKKDLARYKNDLTSYLQKTFWPTIFVAGKI